MLELLGREARFKLAGELIAGSLRESEAELGDLFGRDAARCQILAGLSARGSVQIVLEDAGGGLVHLHERGAELGVGIGVLALGHGDAVALGHQLEGFKEADALDFHDELQNVATDAAAEALVALDGGVDVERRRFFGVERAEAQVSAGGAGAFEADVFADGFDDVDG